MDDLLAADHVGYGEGVPPVRVSGDPEVGREALAALPEELRTVPGAPADPDGARCPRFAHVRKVNPRDRPTGQGGREAILPTQVLRRGIPWGSPYRPGEAESDRGLLFMCRQTSLEDQFELLTARWDEPGPPARGAGEIRARRTRRSARSSDRSPSPGAGYFFGRSLPTLRALADGADL
jgi:hypothetical protein